MACGAPLAAAAPEERRTVTILFVDLVGFTERSDTADPEDVRRTLVPFHEQAKAAIERFGGHLDKFIGDAAMGVFGAPVTHEDDPERAVRAALELVAASEGGHPIRVAVNTGEAVVSMGTGPQVGEAVAGDVVNTASRMQSAAPPGGHRDRRADVDRRPRPLRDQGTRAVHGEGQGGADPAVGRGRRTRGRVGGARRRRLSAASASSRCSTTSWRAPATSGARSWSRSWPSPASGRAGWCSSSSGRSATRSAGCRARALRTATRTPSRR